MKKRAMKKWIPKDTIYCYERLTRQNKQDLENGIPIKVNRCPWYIVAKMNVPIKGSCDEYYFKAFCKYCNEGDDICLDDECKICGEHEGFTDGYEYKTRSGYKIK